MSYSELVDALKVIPYDCLAVRMLDSDLRAGEEGKLPFDIRALAIFASFWEHWQTAQRLLDAVAPDDLQKLAALAGKPWDLATRRALDVIAKPIWQTQHHDGRRETLETWRRVDLSTWPNQLAELEQRTLDLQAIRRNVLIRGGDGGPDAPGGAVVIQAGSGRRAENPASVSVAVVSDAKPQKAAGGGPVDAGPSDAMPSTWWLFFRTTGGQSYADSVGPEVMADIELGVSFSSDNPGAIDQLYEPPGPSEWMVFDLVEDATESEIRLLLTCLERDATDGGRFEFRTVRDDDARKDDVAYVLLRRDWKAVATLSWDDPQVSYGFAQRARGLLAEIRETQGGHHKNATPHDASPKLATPTATPPAGGAVDVRPQDAVLPAFHHDAQSRPGEKGRSLVAGVYPPGLVAICSHLKRAVTEICDRLRFITKIEDVYRRLEAGEHVPGVTGRRRPLQLTAEQYAALDWRTPDGEPVTEEQREAILGDTWQPSGEPLGLNGPTGHRWRELSRKAADHLQEIGATASAKDIEELLELPDEQGAEQIKERLNSWLRAAPAADAPQPLDAGPELAAGDPVDVALQPRGTGPELQAQPTATPQDAAGVMAHNELPHACFRLLESLDEVGIVELLDRCGCPIPVSELVKDGVYSQAAEFLCRADGLVRADRDDDVGAYLTLTCKGAEALARYRLQAAGGPELADTTSSDAGPEPPGPAAKPQHTAGGDDDGMTWQEALDAAEKIRMADKPFTSYRKMAEAIGCTHSVLHDAIAEHGTVELQEWASKQRRASRLNAAPEVSAVAFENTPQAREPDPADITEEGDVDKAMAYLIEQAEKSGPEEAARLRKMPADARRLLAETAYRDPDTSEQIFRWSKRQKKRPRAD